jgi:hypothetical protein
MWASRYGRPAGAWVVAGLLMAGLAACGSARPAQPPQATSPSSLAHHAAPSACPVSVPAVVQLRSSGRLGPAPAAVQLCSYSGGHPTKLRSAAGVTLAASTARTISTLLADETPAGATVLRCVDAPPDVLLRFEYPNAAPVVVAMVDQKPCPTDLVYVRRHSYVISSNLAGYLFFDASAGDVGTSGPRLDLEGMSVDSARRLARRNHVELVVDGEERDPAVPVGTVLLQSPAPNVGEDAGQLEVLIATRDEPTCAPAQLTLDYYGGGMGAGSDFGTIRIRDTSRLACRVSGPIELQGVDGTGQTDTQELTYSVGANLDLTPDAAHVPDGQSPPPGTVIGAVLISAEYRDDPSSPDGSCAAHTIVPATWRLTIGTAVLTVGNDEHEAPARGLDRQLLTCRGELNRPQAVTAG